MKVEIRSCNSYGFTKSVWFHGKRFVDAGGAVCESRRMTSDVYPMPPRDRDAYTADLGQWIADQVEDQFGAQGSYLLDFYPVCDYLSAAAKAIVAPADGQKTWLDEQKIRLKTQRADELLHALQPHLEAPDGQDCDAPVRQCHR